MAFSKMLVYKNPISNVKKDIFVNFRGKSLCRKKLIPPEGGQNPASSPTRGQKRISSPALTKKNKFCHSNLHPCEE